MKGYLFVCLFVAPVKYAQTTAVTDISPPPFAAAACLCYQTDVAQSGQLDFHQHWTENWTRRVQLSKARSVIVFIEFDNGGVAPIRARSVHVRARPYILAFPRTTRTAPQSPHLYDCAIDLSPVRPVRTRSFSLLHHVPTQLPAVLCPRYATWTVLQQMWLQWEDVMAEIVGAEWISCSQVEPCLSYIVAARKHSSI